MILICGGGQLAAAIEQQLRDLGSVVKRGDPARPAGEPLAAESLRHADVLVLAADDDSGNVDLALQARRLRPSLPLVVRLFEPALVSYLSETIPGVAILSMSKVTAPVFVEAARRVLGERPAKRPASPRRSGRRRAYRVDSMLVGALLSDWVLSRRLDVLHGRIRVRARGHVLIVGAGNVALRIAEMLAADGRRLVVAESHGESRDLAALRAVGHHVIVADATSMDTLELAGIDTAALVLAVTDIDAVNLQIALHAREHGVPVVMRLNSGELSSHVTARGDGIALSPIVAAAEAFSQAALAATRSPGANDDPQLP